MAMNDNKIIEELNKIAEELSANTLDCKAFVLMPAVNGVDVYKIDKHLAMNCINAFQAFPETFTHSKPSANKLPYTLNTPQEVWQMAMEMSCSEFCSYYGKLIKEINK